MTKHFGLRISSIRRILKLEMIMEKLIQKGISLCGNKSSSNYTERHVKEGHFAVIAGDGMEAKRFVVPLGCLRNQAFLRLLEQAAEEYGYDHVGAITIPCRPSELEMLLAQQQWHTETTGRVVN